MNQSFQDQPLTPVPIRHQQKLEFARSRQWQQFPSGTQQACRQALARLLCQVMSATLDGSDQENNDER